MYPNSLLKVTFFYYFRLNCIYNCHVDKKPRSFLKSRKLHSYVMSCQASPLLDLYKQMIRCHLEHEFDVFHLYFRLRWQEDKCFLGLLPCILPPGRKGNKRASIDEALASYIAVEPVILFWNWNISFQMVVIAWRKSHAGHLINWSIAPVNEQHVS